MNEIAERIAQKVGISVDQANTAVQMVVSFLKDKLPAPVAGQLDRLIGGAEGAGAKAGEEAKGAMGDVASAVGTIERKAS